MGLMKYYDPVTKKRIPIKAGSLVNDIGAPNEVTPDGVKAMKDNVDGHVASKANPHTVTKAQVGLGNVDNVKQASKTEFDAHQAEKASLTEVGHVQLSNSVTSTSNSLSATPSAVKTAMDRANAAFTSANNGKSLVGSAIIGVDNSIVLPTDPTFNDLASAIGQIETPKMEMGTLSVNRAVTVTGLGFKPKVIHVHASSSSPSRVGLFYNEYSSKTRYIAHQDGGSYLMDISSGDYVSSDGFSLRLSLSDYTVTWYAFG